MSIYFECPPCGPDGTPIFPSHLIAAEHDAAEQSADRQPTGEAADGQTAGDR
ncbi:hypothetical protein [Streptomyces sp. NPDC059786]|uniref:hypothetical protein n=1 Tax=Streptomyces sp. NPDC059786 TaxID=3346946 RepID=UPI003648AF63